MTNPEINVQVDASMPLGQLLEQNKDPNISIKRSAHVGNMFGADLILASLGMNMLLVDANYGEKDKLYFPQLIVDEERDPVEIACSRTLSLANTTKDGKVLSEAMVASIRDAFGNTAVQPDSVFISQNQELIERIVSVLLPAFSELFTRVIGIDGKPFTFGSMPQTVEDVMLLGNVPLKGAIIPNSMNILLDFVVEALTYGTDSIIHISGPTMVTYIDSKMEEINAMYSALCCVGLPLPEVLNVRLVPAAGVRFVVAASQSEDLNEVMALYEEYRILNETVPLARKQLKESNPKATSNDFNTINKPLKAVNAELKATLLQLPQLFFVASPHANTPNFTSQFSALRNGADGTPGSGLYIPNMVLERPIAEITVEFEELDKIRRQK